MLYQFLKVYVTFGLGLFFKKIKVVDRENIPKDGPILFVANHQNALLDALLIATKNNRKTYFLARADAFKTKIAKLLLRYLKMLPVYRIRDGFGTINQNEEIFDECFDLLNKGFCLTIFPEGNHDLKRRLRPLSKGFTRIVFGALEKHKGMNLKIVPIGLNYSNHQDFRGSVSIYFGKPIDAKDYFSGEFNNDSKRLKEVVSTSLKQLIVHIDDLETYKEKMAFIMKENINLLDPEACNKHISSEAVEVNASNTNKKGNSFFIESMGNLIALLNIIHLSIWIRIKKKIKDPVMIGTFKFCIGVFLFPIISLFLATALGLAFGLWAGVGYFIIEIITSPILAKRSFLKG